MVNPLPVELEDGVADLHAVALGLATSLDGPDLGPAGVRPEGRNAQSSTPNAKIMLHRRPLCTRAGNKLSVRRGLESVWGDHELMRAIGQLAFCASVRGPRILVIFIFRVLVLTH